MIHETVAITEEMLSKSRRNSDITTWIKNYCNWERYSWYHSSKLDIGIRLKIVNFRVGLIAMIEVNVCIRYE